jgi:hypothetical protein
MRDLPKKQDAKKDPGLEAQLAPGGSPANHRRECAGHGSHDAAERGFTFQGSIEKEITPHAEGSDEGTEDIDKKSQVQDSASGDRHPENKRLLGQEPPVG